MKSLVLFLTCVPILAAPLSAQETQTLVDNDQVKVEVTRVFESCSSHPLLNAANSSDVDTSSTCTELAITNKSGAPITAWTAVLTVDRNPSLAPGSLRVRRDLDRKPTGCTKFADANSSGEPITSWAVGGSLRPGENSYVWVLLGEGLPNAVSSFIESGATRRLRVADVTETAFKAALFSDGSVFGEPEWTERLVQDRRACYLETIVALQRLREAKQRGAPREQLVQEFNHLEREEMQIPLGVPLPTVPDELNPWGMPVSPTVRKFHLFSTIVWELQQRSKANDEDSLSKDIDRLELMMLDFDKRLLDSKPPITDHPVEPGQPLD